MTNIFEYKSFINKNLDKINFSINNWFIQCFFYKIKLDNKEIFDTHFYNTTFKNITFTNVHFAKNNIEYSNFINCNFKNCTLIKISTYETTFYNTNFINCKIYDTFLCAILDNVTFNYCDFNKDNFNFYKCKLNNVIFKNCDDYNKRFHKCRLNNIKIIYRKVLR